MDFPTRLLDSLRNAWPLYVSMMCALVAGSFVYIAELDTGIHLISWLIIVISAALAFAASDLWVLYPALTMIPFYVISTHGLDNSSHNLLGIEIIMYAIIALIGLIGSRIGLSLRRRLATSSISKAHLSNVRTAKCVGGAILVMGILSWPIAGSIGFIPDSQINALKWSIQKGDKATALSILDNGDTSPNSQSQGWTMLMHAARSRNYDMVKILLERGADPNTKGTGGATALTIAAEDGSTDIGQLLLQYHVNVNARNTNGTTALMYAVENCHQDFVNAMIRAGADLAHHDHDGESAVMIAHRRGHMDILRLLLSVGAKDEMPKSFQDRHSSQSLGQSQPVAPQR